MCTNYLVRLTMATKGEVPLFSPLLLKPPLELLCAPQRREFSRWFVYMANKKAVRKLKTRKGIGGGSLAQVLRGPTKDRHDVATVGSSFQELYTLIRATRENRK